MQSCVREFIHSNEDTALLLVDLGVWPFRDLLEEYPNRVKNIGIFEPGTIGLAAGLSLSGIVPTVYGISPFITQRALEQIKLDFAYQNIAGNFLVTGASYDFSTLGYSHYCPEDVATLRLIPGIEIVTPGTPDQFKALWKSCHDDGNPTYFRMTDYCNKVDCEVEFGKAVVLKYGEKGTVICAAETMDIVVAATAELDVTVLYYTTIVPFDEKTLCEELVGDKLFVCTPFYEGSLSASISHALRRGKYCIEEQSVPLEMIRNYGTKKEKDCYYGLTKDAVNAAMKDFFAD